MKRRLFLQLSSTAMAAGLLPRSPLASMTCQAPPPPPFKISLAQWSLNKGFFGRAEPKLDALDFAKIANSYGIDGLEYVNQFFKDKAKDKAYLSELKKRADEFGCRSLLIMCDQEGNLGSPDQNKRHQAVENHLKWLEAAQFLGCHSIRVNAYSEGSFEEQLNFVVDGYGRLVEKAQAYNLNVIIENHGGMSSNPDWLKAVMDTVNLPNAGTLPDFGNFREYDPYRGTEMLMPYAKGVSAKASYTADGTLRTCDYDRMMRIVRDAGWDGYVGIESGSGNGWTEEQAILKTKEKLEEIQLQWAAASPILDKSLQGWKKIQGGDWSFEDGVLTGTNGRDWTTDSEKAGSWLYYEKPVRDFRFEFQWRLEGKGNSGVMFRSRLDRNPSFTGYEMQITASQNPEPNAKGTPGAIYDLIAPSKNAARPAGQWNTTTITAKGNHLMIDMNFERIIDTRADRSFEGHIGFQNHDERSKVQFKNVRLQNLS